VKIFKLLIQISGAKPIFFSFLKDRMLLVPPEDGSSTNHSTEIHVQKCRQESKTIEDQLTNLQTELYRRNNLAKEMERAQLARKEAEMALLREKARAIEAAEELERQRNEALIEQEQEKTRLIQMQEVQAAHQKETSQIDMRKSVINKALEGRETHRNRQPLVDEFAKKYKKIVNGCKMRIRMTGETVQDLKRGFHGVGKDLGAGAFLEKVRSKGEETYELAMHLIADTIIEYSATNTAPDSIKSGETKYSMVYLSLSLCVHFDGFYQILMGSLYSACPDCVPGLRNALMASLHSEKSISVRRSTLGYLDKEGNSDYIARMQTIIGFLAGVFQTPIKMLWLEPFEMVPPSTLHPVPGGEIVGAWRWLAGTMNADPNRWTMYVIHSFVAVAGSELSRHCGVQMVKLAKVLSSEAFINRCKKAGNFDLKVADNDVDRLKTYKYFMDNAVQQGLFSKPGKEGHDVRQLVLEVSQNRD